MGLEARAHKESGPRIPSSHRARGDKVVCRVANRQLESRNKSSRDDLDAPPTATPREYKAYEHMASPSHLANRSDGDCLGRPGKEAARRVHPFSLLRQTTVLIQEHEAGDFT